MSDKATIIRLIKSSIEATEPGATVILYGSYARGDYHEESDIDLIVLVDKDKITWADEKRISFPLYDIEFNTGLKTSPSEAQVATVTVLTLTPVSMCGLRTVILLPTMIAFRSNRAGKWKVFLCYQPRKTYRLSTAPWPILSLPVSVLEVKHPAAYAMY